MTLDEIKDLIRLVSKTGVNKVSIEREGFKINIVGQSTSKEAPVYFQAPAAPVQSAPIATTPNVESVTPKADSGEDKVSDDSKFITVKSPMIGTFYRSPGPDKDPFVGVGSMVSNGDKLCIIEAMKTFNEIESEVSGKIVKVLVDDSSPVDYDQPLFLVDPN